MKWLDKLDFWTFRKWVHKVVGIFMLVITCLYIFGLAFIYGSHQRGHVEYESSTLRVGQPQCYPGQGDYPEEDDCSELEEYNKREAEITALGPPQSDPHHDEGEGP